MKKRILFSIIVFLFVFTILIVCRYISLTHARYEELKKQAGEYLYEKYSKHAVFEENPNFYDSVYTFYNVHFENEDVYFIVTYIEPASKFDDGYLTMLENRLR